MNFDSRKVEKIVQLSLFLTLFLRCFHEYYISEPYARAFLTNEYIMKLHTFCQIPRLILLSFPRNNIIDIFLCCAVQTLLLQRSTSYNNQVKLLLKELLYDSFIPYASIIIGIFACKMVSYCCSFCSFMIIFSYSKYTSAFICPYLPFPYCSILFRFTVLPSYFVMFTSRAIQKIQYIEQHNR